MKLNLQQLKIINEVMTKGLVSMVHDHQSECDVQGLMNEPDLASREAEHVISIIAQEIRKEEAVERVRRLKEELAQAEGQVAAITQTYDQGRRGDAPRVTQAGRRFA